MDFVSSFVLLLVFTPVDRVLRATKRIVTELSYALVLGLSSPGNRSVSSSSRENKFKHLPESPWVPFSSMEENASDEVSLMMAYE